MPASKISFRSVRSVYALSALISFTYFFIRSITVPITYDEVVTVIRCIQQGYSNIILYTADDANTHVVNSVLIRMLYSFLPDTAFVARIPNIIAGAFFLFFSYRICSRYLNPFTGIVCFSLLILNPFLLDFFSLARGYGLALGFTLGSLYYFMRFVRDGEQRSGLPSLILASLATLSCFSFLNLLVILSGAYCILPLLRKEIYTSKKPYFHYAAVMFIFSAFAYFPLKKLNTGNILFYGGSRDLWHDTFFSLTKFTMYEEETAPVVYLVMIVFSAAVLLVLFAAIYFRRQFYTLRNGMFAILLLSILFLVVQHEALGVLYVIDRTAIYFIPLVILLICFCLDDLPDKWWRRTIGTAFVIVFAVNFGLRANFNKSALWFFDMHTKEILQTMNDRGEKSNTIIRLGYSPVFQSTVEYYYNFDRDSYPFLRVSPETVDGKVIPETHYIYLDRPLDVVYDPRKDRIHGLKKTQIKKYDDANIRIYQLD